MERNWKQCVYKDLDEEKDIGLIVVSLERLKEARKGFFGCYSVCETMKDTKEGYFIM